MAASEDPRDTPTVRDGSAVRTKPPEGEETVSEGARTEPAPTDPAPRAEAAAAVPIAGSEPAPRRIAQYDIYAPLGRGGMANVYRAFDTKLDRFVALKTLVPSTGRGDADRHRRRIMREARASAALKHPNVVTVYEVGEENGIPFIAMELVEGPSLRGAASEATPLATRLRWLLDAARALEAAHARGLVHRDVKPENMMVDEHGALRLLDFGIAKREEDELVAALPTALLGNAEGPSSLRTVEGVRIGTPRYMAPEQIEGRPSDSRTDQFAWGMVAFELLTGTPPRREDGRVDLDPTLLALLDGCGVSEGMRATVRRALARDQEARFPSMSEVISALELELESSSSGAASAVASAPRGEAAPAPRRRTLVFGGLVIAAVATVGGLAALGVQTWRRPRAPSLESHCTATPGRIVADYSPSELIALDGGRALVGGYERQRTDQPPSGVDIVDLLTGKRSDFLAAHAPGIVQSGAVLAPVVRRGRPWAIVVAHHDDWTPTIHRGRTVIAAAEPEGASVSQLTEVVPSAVAAIDTDDGLLVALTGSVEEVEGQSVVMKRGQARVVAIALVDGPDAARAGRHSIVYETKESELGGLSLARRSTGYVVAFREGVGVSVLFLDGQRSPRGQRLSLAREGESGTPTVATVGDRTYVAFAHRQNNVTRLVLEALDVSGTRVPVPEIEASPIGWQRPSLVPVATGGLLLAWSVATPAGTKVRAARLGARPSRAFEVGTDEDVALLAAGSSADGALVAWKNAKARSVRTAVVSCATSPAFASQ